MMLVEDSIKAILAESIAVKQHVMKLAPRIAYAAETLIEALRQGKKIFVCGNGGSAADAQHMAGELVGRFERERRGFPCIALTTDSSVVTAWTNDYSYESVFSRQVSALGEKDDILLGISTSGKSKNIIYALEEATKKGMKALALLGRDGGLIKDMPDVFGIIVPSDSTPRIQESHITIIHIWCKLIDDTLSDFSSSQ
jgi:D-sedoheptulose 7-phosphate isomerase